MIIIRHFVNEYMIGHAYEEGSYEPYLEYLLKTKPESEIKFRTWADQGLHKRAFGLLKQQPELDWSKPSMNIRMDNWPETLFAYPQHVKHKMVKLKSFYRAGLRASCEHY